MPFSEEIFLQILHDIKSPILGVKFALESIERSAFEQEIYESNLKVLNLIDDFLYLKNVKNMPKTENVDLAQLILGEISCFKYIFQKKELIFNFSKNSPKCLIKVNSLTLQRIFSNLILNAIKYAKNSSDINVSLLCTKTYASVSIENFIDTLQTDRLNLASNGLGLIICKRLCVEIKAKISQTKAGNKMIYKITLPKG